MPKPKQYRWVCPRCGAGKLAPSRPRKDDVRRYCLACSERTGRLVRRLSPALERQRRDQQERRKAKTKRKRATERKRRENQRQAVQERRQEREALLGLPFSLESFVRRVQRLKAWGADLTKVGIKIRFGEGSWTSGHAKRNWWYIGDGTMITVTIGKGATPENTLETIVHEYAHHADYRHSSGGHGEVMKRLLINAVEELTGLEVDAQVDAGHCYKTVDPACRESIKAWLKGEDDAEDQDGEDQAGE